MPEVEQRAAIVTGLGRQNGIGAEICRLFAARGIRLCYSFWNPYDRRTPWGSDDDLPYRFVEELRATGVDAHAVEADLSRPDAPAELLERTRSLLGEVSILVNNAAVSETGDIAHLDAAMLDRHYAVNVRGMALLCQIFIRQFTRGVDGRNVNLTSGQGQCPMPDELAYATSKGAAEAFTTSLSPHAAARGVTVNAVNPGPADTGWIPDELRPVLLSHFPMSRIGAPRGVANLIGFLVSSDGGWITGQVINSEGGF